MTELSKDERDKHILSMVEQMADILLKDGKPAHVTLAISLLITYFIGNYPVKKQQQITDLIERTALVNVAHLSTFAIESVSQESLEGDERRKKLYEKFGMLS